MELEFRISDKVYGVSVEFKDSVYTVRRGDSEWKVEFNPMSENLFSLRIDGRIHRIYLAESKGKKHLSIMGRQFCVEKHETSIRATVETEDSDQTATVCPPMPGMVVKINVSEGDIVRKNQTIAVVEAMKMENDLKSPMKGRVKKIHVSEGDLVDAGKPIVELEAD